MVKVYFDWNVMAQMKDGSHKKLKEIVFKNNKFFKPYSTSHISDIFSSFKENTVQAELIKRDLEFISELTNDTFIFNNGKEIEIDFAHPKEYYNQLVEEKDQFKDISIGGLFKNLEADEMTRDLVRPLLNSLKEIPLDSIFKEAFENPESSKQMEMMFPGLKENQTMEGFFQSYSEMLKGLNEDEKYKDLRKVVQLGLGINRDKIFDSKNPYDIINTRYAQIGQEKIQHGNNDKNAPKWFNEISNEYLLLDMHGYQEDKVTILKGRKETFKNTTEDAFHCAFASTCNFYVINDNKSYKKSKQIYEQLQINTLVYKPDEFVEFYNNYFDIKDKLWNVNMIFELIEKGEYVEEQLENGIMRTYYFPYFIFDFFNKIIVVFPSNSDPAIILLSRNKPTNGQLYVMEITKVAKEITDLFGQDLDSLGEVTENEFKEENWIGRRWKINKTTFSLVSTNGHIQLYLSSE